MKRNRPSGSQQRKMKKGREQVAQAMSGSILKYVTPSTSSVIVESSEDIQPSESEGQIKEASSEKVNEKERRLKDGNSSSKSIESDEEEESASRNLHQEEDSDIEDESDRFPVYYDVAAWPIPVPNALRVDLIKRGSEPFQNKDGPFSVVHRQGEKSKGKYRQMTTAWFYMALPNGEKVLRSWIVYSNSKESLYCFCCRLFALDDKGIGTSRFVTGFQTWWKLNPKVFDHEASDQHLSCLEKWKTLGAGLKLHKTIDQVHQGVMDKKRKKWKDILHRLLDVTLFLAHQNLPFRGHKEGMLSANKGNFMEFVELLSNYDPVKKNI